MISARQIRRPHHARREPHLAQRASPLT
jgi:hypothetical protein